jgi:hypothetical protein
MNSSGAGREHLFAAIILCVYANMREGAGNDGGSGSPVVA